MARKRQQWLVVHDALRVDGLRRAITGAFDAWFGCLLTDPLAWWECMVRLAIPSLLLLQQNEYSHEPSSFNKMHG